ncbi:fimbria/pilus outer membrane usher protein [Rhizobium sp. XQZ8]|uniref:fimbria/pilus outer membrane usher protein n=1 Tax=Rhizobium populisoli TaxID=2859785 RepID=UPI001CA4717E|nr:fimbria/pilus outer membrane usher protein [Rhizobium populisoli]MBW6424945.1 fimbria/pilus outer membrane usher protein [Rhizobium populisoli]
MSDVEGSRSSRAATVAYRSGSGRVEGRVEQSDKNVSVRGQVDGALILAGGDVFISDRIEDSFGIVDAGTPDVAVEFENRPAGKTNRHGRLLVPNLRSYEENSLSIDPAGLPIDAVLDSARETVMPHKGSGVVVRFAVKPQTGAALVTLKTSTARSWKAARSFPSKARMRATSSVTMARPI